MKYRGFEITACNDSGVERYNSAENRDEICEGYFCEVYPAGDDQYADQLDTFCLAQGYEIPDTSDEALDAGIRKYIDDNYYGLWESKNEVKQKRTEELVGRLVCWLGENESGAELYDTLSKNIGMTDEEICAIGFRSLTPFFDREQYAQTIADWLIDDGTQSTLSGSWLVYRAGGNLLLGYDVFVKDDPESEEWLCYDNPTDPVSLREQDMLAVLDRIASENELSYTESNFETLDGKEISVKEKPAMMSLWATVSPRVPTLPQRWRKYPTNRLRAKFGRFGASVRDARNPVLLRCHRVDL